MIDDTTEDFVSRIELSVRASNVLRAAGVATAEEFMGLTKDDVMAMKNAGIRTWREISEIQTYLTPDTTLARLRNAAREWNKNILNMPRSHRYHIDRDGMLHLYKDITYDD